MEFPEQMELNIWVTRLYSLLRNQESGASLREPKAAWVVVFPSGLILFK